MSLSPSDVREGLEGPPLVIDDVTRDMFVRYAGASGDFNPIHWNEDYAGEAGYPGVFGMGMFTAGVLAGFLTRWLGATSVRRYRVRFTGQVWPGETLVCTGRIAAVYAEAVQTRVECDLEVANSDGDRKIAGSAVCVLPAREASADSTSSEGT